MAVANAVDAIKAHADVTLRTPDGQGVAELLRGPLLAGRAQCTRVAGRSLSVSTMPAER